jgi:hypothetical protein
MYSTFFINCIFFKEGLLSITRYGGEVVVQFHAVDYRFELPPNEPLIVHSEQQVFGTIIDGTILFICHL